LEIRSGHFLEVVIVDFSSAGRHQENFGRTSTKNAQAAKSANAHCNFGAPRALRRSLSVIHSRSDLGRISNGIKIKNFLILMVKKSKNGKKTTSRMSFSRSEIDLFQLLPKMKSRQGWS